MADAFKRWAVGEPFVPIKAQLDAWTDAAKKARGVPLPPRGTGDPVSWLPVQIINKTGAAVPLFGVVKLDKPYVDPNVSGQERAALGSIVMEGTVPAADDRQIAVLLEPLKNSATAIGWAYLMGAGYAKVDMGSASDKKCGPTSSTANLVSGSGPFDILWSPPSATGVQVCIVRIGGGGDPNNFCWADLSDVCPAGSPGHVDGALQTLEWNGTTLVATDEDPRRALNYDDTPWGNSGQTVRVFGEKVTIKGVGEDPDVPAFILAPYLLTRRAAPNYNGAEAQAFSFPAGSTAGQMTGDDCE